jgi:hypothetical protein
LWLRLWCFSLFSFFDDTKRALIEAIQLRFRQCFSTEIRTWIQNSNPNNHDCLFQSAPSPRLFQAEAALIERASPRWPEVLRDLRQVHHGLDTAGEQVVKRAEDRRSRIWRIPVSDPF